LAGQGDAFARVMLVSEDPPLIAAARALSLPLPLTIEPGGESSFHFGRVLKNVCEKHDLSRVVYAGGAALPLATGDLLRDLSLSVSGDAPCVVANSLYSADFMAFHPAEALSRIDLPSTDNNLAWQLHYNAGLPFASTPRTLASHFDIDTPPDLAVLYFAFVNDLRPAPASTLPSVGQYLAQVLSLVPQVMPTLSDRLSRAYAVMATRRAHLLLTGRVSAWVWRRLEVNLPCQTRVLSEERGMQAGGREARGEVRSLLGLHLDAVGLEGLVTSLEATCDAAFLDTRVLFAHRRLKVSRADRFFSDTLQPDQISDPWVRDLTSAFASTTIPIVMGGHSLVSGGVWALSEKVRSTASAAL
jgi:hypothetical protein